MLKNICIILVQIGGKRSVEVRYLHDTSNQSRLNIIAKGRGIFMLFQNKPTHSAQCIWKSAN